MDTRAWFTLAVRLAGLGVMILALPGVGRALDGLFAYLWYWNWSLLRAVGGSNIANFSDRSLFEPVGHLLQFSIGACLWIRGRRLVARLAPSDGTFCSHCGYDLRGSSLPRCPECGRLAPPKRAPPKPSV
jgi:hypothetical protein